MKKNKIIVVGSSSFLGSNLISFFDKKTIDIIRLQRSKFDSQIETDKVISWTLGDKIPDEQLKTANWIICCAHDINSNVNNEIGYKKILEQIKAYPNLKCIYISSYSAFKDAESDYGKTKYILENAFMSLGHYIIRPGLIIGNGGLFYNLFTNIIKYPIVPIIGFKTAPIFYIDIKDLCLFIERVIETSPNKKDYNLFYSKTTNQVNLAKAIKKSKGRMFFYLRLPILLFEIIIFVGNLLKIKLPITKENLKGYKQNTQVNRQSDLGISDELAEPNLLDILKRVEKSL